MDNSIFSFENNALFFVEKYRLTPQNLMSTVDNLKEKLQFGDNFRFFSDLSPKLSTDCCVQNQRRRFCMKKTA